MTPLPPVPGSPGAVVRRWAGLLALTAVLAAALALVHVPAAELFAGLVVATAMALLGRAPCVPPRLSVAAQAVLGVTIGALVQPSTLGRLGGQWVAVVAVSIGTLAVSMAAGAVMGRRRGISPLTGMLALTAGGASGLTAISRELGGDDRVVAVVQYLRVGIVTATMPLIAVVGFGATAGGAAAATPGGSVPGALGFLVVCTAAGLGLAALIRLPAGGLLGPMAVAIALTVSGLWSAAAPPDVVVELAYAVIGWQAGVRFTRDSLRTVITVLPLACLLIVAIIAACAGLGLLLSAATGATVLEGYLATTPGGVYAVLATAISAGGDVTFVVATQVLRVIVMLLVAPVLARFAR